MEEQGNREMELSLKERALALKEKELELREKDAEVKLREMELKLREHAFDARTGPASDRDAAASDWKSDIAKAHLLVPQTLGVPFSTRSTTESIGKMVQHASRGMQQSTERSTRSYTRAMGLSEVAGYPKATRKKKTSLENDQRGMRAVISKASHDASAGQKHASIEETTTWQAHPDDREEDPNPLIIVAIGISAGGLESLQRFLSGFPAGTGVAIVVCQHLLTDYPSMMVEIISKTSALKVEQVEDQVVLEAEHVYMTPPGKIFSIKMGRFHVSKREEHINRQVNYFFLSLAYECYENAIGIILSGTGSDGSEGIVAIKSCGGITMAQDSSAKFDGMPLSAIETGQVDLIGPPEDLARHVVAIARYPSASSAVIGGEMPMLHRILGVVDKQTGKSFREYKEGTVLRRIQRQMNVNKCSTPDEYLDLLIQSPRKALELQSDLLIHVTSFFRDAQTWAYIYDQVLPTLFASLRQDESEAQPAPLAHGNNVRIWVVGCSTGQEAYTYAILAAEVIANMNVSGDAPPITIFATDSDSVAVDSASKGIYKASEVQGIPPEMLKRYFTEQDGMFTVVSSIRKMVVFAVHDILHNPPFNRMSLISCRNVLIYFKLDVQSNVQRLFHYALARGGFMVLGVSESVTGEARHLFVTESESCKVFCSQGVKRSRPSMLITNTPRTQVHGTSDTHLDRPLPEINYNDVAVKLLAKRYAPPAVVFTDANMIVSTFGNVDPFISITSSANAVSLDVIKCARRGLAAALSIATRKCRQGAPEAVFRGVSLAHDDEQQQSVDDAPRPSRVVDLVVRRLEGTSSPAYIATFEDSLAITVASANATSASSSAPSDSGVVLQQASAFQERMQELESELMSTRTCLQQTVEELEGTNEELQSTVEELLSGHEELQSTNEELQSVNEELYTVNQEYQDKIRDLADLNLDLANLLSGTRIGCIFLDKQLQIRKFTRAARDRIPLLESDLGRPIRDLTGGSVFAPALNSLEQIIKEGGEHEYEVEQDGLWFCVRLLPYQNDLDQTIGVVITFHNVTTLHQAILEADKSRDLAEQAHRAKSDFLANMSHEVRTPMNSICGFSEILAHAADLKPHHRRLVVFIYKSSRLLTALLEDVLGMSAMEHGRTDLLTEEFSPLDAIYEICELVALAAAEQDLDLIVDFDPRVDTNALGDVVRLRQILLNLVSNAVKFCTTQGSITVECRLLDEKVLDDDHICFGFSVADTGPGIPAEALDGIFDQFVQVDPSLSRRVGGIGLGLSIANRFAQLMGGQLEVKSTVGVGSQFNFHVFVKRNAAGCTSLRDDVTFESGRVHLLLPNSRHCSVLAKMLSGLQLLGSVAGSTELDIATCASLLAAIESKTRTKKSIVVLEAHLFTQLETTHKGLWHAVLNNDLMELLVVCNVADMLTGTSPSVVDDMPNVSVHPVVHPIRIDWLVQLTRLGPSKASVSFRKSSWISAPEKPVQRNLAEQKSPLEVLIIEDNILNQRVMKRMLETFGCSVTVTSGGIEGIQACRSHVFDFVFCDLAMPDLDGFAVATQVRSLPSYGAVPLIAATATVTSVARTKAAAAGFSGFLTKPITLKSIESILESPEMKLP